MQKKDLSLIGFNSYESRIISVLLGGIILGVREIYLKTRIPKNKIYETVEALKGKGIIGEEAVKPKRYYIINDDLLDELIAKRKEGLERLQSWLEERKRSKDMINPSVLSIIDGDEEVHRLIEYSNLSVMESIKSCSRLERMHYGCYRSLKNAVKRGVKVKFIAIDSGKNNEVLKAYHDIGVQIRLWQLDWGVFPKISLFDDRLTRITIWKPDVEEPKDYRTIWAKSSILHEIVNNHFEAIWNRCSPFAP